MSKIKRRIIIETPPIPLYNGPQRALGRPPRDFSDYARVTVATGIWGQPADQLGIDQPDFSEMSV